MSDISTEELIGKILRSRKNVAKIRLSIDLMVSKIEKKYSPRAEFDNWRNSDDGQKWRIQQYNLQNHCCAECKKPLDLKDSHIDHIKTIAKYPQLNLDLRNLQITHPSCNLYRSKKDI
jgi:5-methylcytosine-specific restriction endonuclease McrA